MMCKYYLNALIHPTNPKYCLNLVPKRLCSSEISWFFFCSHLPNFLCFEMLDADCDGVVLKPIWFCSLEGKKAYPFLLERREIRRILPHTQTLGFSVSLVAAHLRASWCLWCLAGSSARVAVGVKNEWLLNFAVVLILPGEFKFSQYFVLVGLDFSYYVLVLCIWLSSFCRYSGHVIYVATNGSCNGGSPPLL